MTNTTANETTPDELMEAFRGRSLGSIIVFTVVVHAILLLGTSVPFIYKTVLGADSSALSEEERVEIAVKEATASLREIAEEHGLKPQDLSNQFTAGKPRAPKPAAAKPETTGTTGTTDPAADPELPGSTFEAEINKVESGPSVPPIEPEEDDEEEDLFK